MPPFAATISKLANVILLNERLKMVINVRRGVARADRLDFAPGTNVTRDST
jgi:hypothetical protein